MNTMIRIQIQITHRKKMNIDQKTWVPQLSGLSRRWMGR
jgi:hypothetical protein